MPQRPAFRAVWWKHFLNWGFFFTHDSFLCQLKTTTNNHHNYKIIIIYIYGCKVALPFVHTMWTDQIPVISLSINTSTCHFFVKITFKIISFHSFEIEDALPLTTHSAFVCCNLYKQTSQWTQKKVSWM